LRLEDHSVELWLAGKAEIPAKVFLQLVDLMDQPKRDQPFGDDEETNRPDRKQAWRRHRPIKVSGL